MEPRQQHPKGMEQRQQVPELPSASQPKRRFQIEKLEERIAPGNRGKGGWETPSGGSTIP